VPMRRVYYDSSAVVKLLREEDFTADIARWVDNPRMEAVSGRLTETEVRRMAERDGIPQDLVTETLDRFEIFGHPDWEFRAAGVIPARSLRALDALHIAAAIRIQADAIITYDDRMAEAAMAMGLAVIQPGAGDPESEPENDPAGDPAFIP